MPASALMNIMTRAVRKAGRRLVRDFGEVEQLQISVKGPGDFVSQADLAAEEILFEELSAGRHGYGFIMEERGLVEGSDKSHRWIVDPLDGTTNFLHGLPHFAISVGLERQGEMVAAIVYNPVTDELFSAEKGGGAFVNDRRMRVAGRRRIGDCVFATGIPHANKPGLHKRAIVEIATLMPQVAGIRRFGSAALDLAFVAAGRFDAFWERGLRPWDIAAGMLLVTEAGGITTDALGRRKKEFETGSVLAGNADVHDALRKVLDGVQVSQD
ncbi:MAG: inositol monophosphatase family protein [Pseudomonadota bacterium]